MSMFHCHALSKRPKTFEQVNVSWDDFRDERASLINLRNHPIFIKFTDSKISQSFLRLYQRQKVLLLNKNFLSYPDMYLLLW